MERLNKGDKLWIAACVMMAIAAYAVGFAVGRSRATVAAPAVAKEKPSKPLTGMELARDPEFQRTFLAKRWADVNARDYLQEKLGRDVLMISDINEIRLGDGKSMKTGHVVTVTDSLSKTSYVVIVWQTPDDLAGGTAHRWIFQAVIEPVVGADMGY